MLAARTEPGPIKYHGGKTRLARRIIDLMPSHLHYVEPYFGGGAVLFAKDPTGVSEVVNDLDTNLTNFWRVVQDERSFTRFQQLVEAIPFSEAEFRDAQAVLGPPAAANDTGANGDASPGPGQDRVRRSVVFFIMCRQSLAGRQEAFAMLTRNRLRRGMNELPSARLSAVAGLAEVHSRLRRVVVLNRDALAVIRSQDGPQTLFYLDPPYLQLTRSAPEVYTHEMTAEGHLQLLKTIRRIQGRFLLSGYTNKLYSAAEEKFGWRRVEFELPNNAAGGASKRRMTECTWMNF